MVYEEMNSKFFELKKEKQDRMINGALKEFALYGFLHASTDRIVKYAGISKGLLFHYFENKLGLYTFVYEYSVRYMLLELSGVSQKEKDLFELFRQIQGAHFRVMREYPYMQQFLTRSRSEDVGVALLAVEDLKNQISSRYQDLYKQVDYSLLPAGVDGKKMRNTIEFTINGLMNEHFLDASFQPEMLYREICSYLDMLSSLCSK